MDDIGVLQICQQQKLRIMKTIRNILRKSFKTLRNVVHFSTVSLCPSHIPPLVKFPKCFSVKHTLRCNHMYTDEDNIHDCKGLDKPTNAISPAFSFPTLQCHVLGPYKATRKQKLLINCSVYNHHSRGLRYLLLTRCTKPLPQRYAIPAAMSMHIVDSFC